jgi:hypothetical protein
MADFITQRTMVSQLEQNSDYRAADEYALSGPFLDTVISTLTRACARPRPPAYWCSISTLTCARTHTRAMRAVFPPSCVRAHAGDASRKFFHPHARARDTCRLVPCFSSSVEPCGYVGRFAASPNSRRSRVRPPHSPWRRSFAKCWASSSETHSESRRKPAFFILRLCRARSSALPLRAVFVCCSGVMW